MALDCHISPSGPAAAALGPILDDGPAFLTRVDKGRFTLSDAHRPQREFIVAQGNKELARSTAGKRSAAARQRKLPDRKKAGGSE